MIAALRCVLVLGAATLVEAIRNRVLLIALFFAVMLIGLSVAAASVSYGERGRMIVDVGLAAASGIGSLIAVALTVTAFAAELRKRTAYTLLARPVPRWAFVFGKLAGVTAAMQLVVGFMVLATAGTVWLYGTSVPTALWACLWLTWMEVAMVCAITLLFSTIAEPVLAATYSVAVVLAGNLSTDLAELARRADQPQLLSQAIGVAYRVLPDLEALSTRVQAANQLPLPEGLLVHGTLYGVAYTLAAGLLAAMAFFTETSHLMMSLALLSYIATFVASLGLGLYLTPLVRRGAIAFGVLDRPDGRLKQQAEPVPYLGGVAIYLAFLVTLALVFDFEPQLLGLLLGGTMMAMLGLFDDLRVLPPRLKLFGQLLVAWVLVKSGIAIQHTALPFWLAPAATVLWLVLVTNATNIIDVADGLASGVAAIAALALFIIAAVNGHVLIATTTLALVGALVAFLRYNQPPAQIYLGDTGSLFVGFMLAALSMLGAYTRTHPMGVLAPVFILAVPLLDTLLVSLARMSRGQSPMLGSPDHFAVRLRQHGWSARRIAALAYGLGGLGGVAGLALVLAPPQAALVLAGLSTLVFTGVFVWFWRLAPTRRAASMPVVAYAAALSAATSA